MFSKVTRGDTVLVSVPGNRASMFETAKTFPIPMQVNSHTPTRFTAGGITYKRKDGYSYPAGNGHCQPYEASKDGTLKLEAYNAVAAAVSGINNHLHSLGRLRVKREIENPHTILKQIEILAALIKGGTE